MMTSRRWWVVGPGGRRGLGGDCIMPRQAWETTASARKVSASRFERGSKGSWGSHGAEGAPGTQWQGRRLRPTSHDPSPAAPSQQSEGRPTAPTPPSPEGLTRAATGLLITGLRGRWHLQIPQLPRPEGCSGRALLTVAVFINRFSTAA